MKIHPSMKIMEVIIMALRTLWKWIDGNGLHFRPTVWQWMLFFYGHHGFDGLSGDDLRYFLNTMILDASMEDCSEVIIGK
jgi:hypothetical protein